MISSDNFPRNLSIEPIDIIKVSPKVSLGSIVLKIDQVSSSFLCISMAAPIAVSISTSVSNECIESVSSSLCFLCELHSFSSPVFLEVDSIRVRVIVEGNDVVVLDPVEGLVLGQEEGEAARVTWSAGVETLAFGCVVGWVVVRIVRAAGSIRLVVGRLGSA